MGCILSVTCFPNMNARRQLVSDLNLEVGVLGICFKNVRSEPSCDHTFLQMHIVYKLATYLRVGMIFGGEDIPHASPRPSESPPLQYSPLATSPSAFDPPSVTLVRPLLSFKDSFKRMCMKTRHRPVSTQLSRYFTPNFSGP